MKSIAFTSIRLGFLALTLISGAACQTTLAAKAGPGANSETANASKTGGSCNRAPNNRSDCEDQVGCAWSYDAGSCVSH